jgi:hypothetical protein
MLHDDRFLRSIRYPNTLPVPANFKFGMRDNENGSDMLDNSDMGLWFWALIGLAIVVLLVVEIRTPSKK